MTGIKVPSLWGVDLKPPKDLAELCNKDIRQWCEEQKPEYLKTVSELLDNQSCLLFNIDSIIWEVLKGRE